MPQITDIMRANARDVKQSFENVSKEVIPHFEETAKEILTLHSPEDALCRAMAIITGYTK